MRWDEAASFSWWKAPPPYFVQEMGRPYDKDAPEGRNLILEQRGAKRTTAPDTYLLPGGFRCVR